MHDVVQRLFDLWEVELPRLSGKSKLAEAIRYAISRRAALECFLSDGRVEIDSNIVERAIRPQTITRKNALLVQSRFHKKTSPSKSRSGSRSYPIGKVPQGRVVWQRSGGPYRQLYRQL